MIVIRKSTLLALFILPACWPSTAASDEKVSGMQLEEILDAYNEMNLEIMAAADISSGRLGSYVLGLSLGEVIPQFEHCGLMKVSDSAPMDMYAEEIRATVDFDERAFSYAYDVAYRVMSMEIAGKTLDPDCDVNRETFSSYNSD